MTSEELITLRKAFGITQTEMAERIGLKLRAYQDLEAGKSEVRKIHDEAVAMVSLHIAVERGNPMLALPEVRKLALRLAQQITGDAA